MGGQDENFKHPPVSMASCAGRPGDLDVHEVFRSLKLLGLVLRALISLPTIS